MRSPASNREIQKHKSASVYHSLTGVTDVSEPVEIGQELGKSISPCKESSIEAER